MGYDLHITRAENWYDNQGFEISSREWRTLVQDDPELIPRSENGENFAVWRGSTKYPESWFDWSNGNIYTKAPDKATLRKMLQIAQKLNAKIQGDDGEFYDYDSIESFDDSYLDNLGPPKPNKFNKIFISLLCLLLIPFIVFIIFLVLEISFH